MNNELKAALDELLDARVDAYIVTGQENNGSERIEAYARVRSARAVVEALFADAVKDAERLEIYFMGRCEAHEDSRNAIIEMELRALTEPNAVTLNDWRKAIDSARSAVSPEVTK